MSGENDVIIDDCALKEGFSDTLLEWYKKNRRILPWREDPSPYHVWLSEIMLQQTRVEAVRDHYLRFIDRLPDIRSLAEAPEDVYLKLWEGLGYYSRVRNLHRAACVITKEYGGEMPETSSVLVKLPGIGPYTAAAIASIAFGEPSPAVDGNLLRVFARLTRYEENIRTTEALRAATLYYRERMPESAGPENSENPCGDFNQALMDLGAAICLPNAKPDCANCPLSKHCRAYNEIPGGEHSLPLRSEPKERKTEHLTVFLIRCGEKTAVAKRPVRGLLAGLYEFPNAKGELDDEEAVKWLRDHSVEPIRILRLLDAEHVFTHKVWKMRGYEVITDPFSENGIPFLMADKEEILLKYSIPSAFGAYLERL